MVVFHMQEENEDSLGEKNIYIDKYLYQQLNDVLLTMYIIDSFLI